jgi:PKD repeat protein
MIYTTKYYWKIIAWDNQGVSSIGPIWDFTTKSFSSSGDDTPPINDSVIIYQKPTAIISGPYFGTPNEEIEFNATDSHDNDEEGQSIVRFDWKFLDEQKWQINLSATPTYIYTQEGIYNVTLRVIDDEGNFSINTTTVTIIKPNYPPTANFSHLPLKPTTDDVNQFTDLSTDSDGTIVSYYWDFNDGITSTERNPTHKYSEHGVYTITLNVTDDGGATNTMEHIILVKDSQNKDINTETNKKAPGFDLFFVICAIAIVILLWKKRNT